MGFELGFEKNNFLGNGIGTPLHDPLYEVFIFRLIYFRPERKIVNHYVNNTCVVQKLRQVNK